MSKLKQLFAAGAVVSISLLGASPAFAVDECTISNTGPGSNNECEVKNDYSCKVENDNVIIVDNNNQQVATSGGASNSGNTSGGGSTSGSATNSNGTTFNFEVTNDGCNIVTVTQPSPQTPVTPQGSGAVAAQGQGQGAITSAPVSLPLTSGNTTAGILVIIASLLATAIVTVRSLKLSSNQI